MIKRKQKLDFINAVLQGDLNKAAELKRELEQEQNKKYHVAEIIETNDDGTYNCIKVDIEILDY